MGKITFSLMRDGVTATSVEMDIQQLGMAQRWVASSLRRSGADASRYQFVAYSDEMDISATDWLEEITGTVTGAAFCIVNKRELTGSHMEFDLDRTAHGLS